MDFEYTVYTTSTKSYTQGGNLKAEEAVEVNIGLDEGEINALSCHENLFEVIGNHDIAIYTPVNNSTEDEIGHHDDVLEALHDVLTILNKIENGKTELDGDRVQKIRNTYEHYKTQQERYQQTNK